MRLAAREGTILGAETLVARTTASNPAALAILRRLGAELQKPTEGLVRAELRLLGEGRP